MRGLMLIALLAFVALASARSSICANTCSIKRRFNSRGCNPIHCHLKACLYKHKGKFRSAFRCAPKNPCGSKRCNRWYIHTRRSCNLKFCDVKRCKGRRAFQCLPKVTRCLNKCLPTWRKAKSGCNPRYCRLTRCKKGSQFRGWACRLPRERPAGIRRPRRRPAVQPKPSMAPTPTTEATDLTSEPKRQHMSKGSSACGDRCYKNIAEAENGCDLEKCSVKKCFYPLVGYKCTPRDELQLLEASLDNDSGTIVSPTPLSVCIGICGSRREVTPGCSRTLCKLVSCSDDFHENGLSCVAK